VSETTPRQVLYALVAGGFMVVVAILVVAGAVAGVVPSWWSVTLAVVIFGVGMWMAWHWRSTGPMLLIAIGVFVIWLVGTLILAI
jgi:hypothetical protein